MVAKLATVALAAAVLCQVEARTRETFDFDWKYILGDQNYAPVCDTSGFTQNISGYQCFGLSQTGATNSADCQLNCCTDNTCTIWQFDTVGSQGCWIGNDCSDNATQSDWLSFERAPPPPNPPPQAPCTDPTLPCSVTYPDTPWRTVNTPHDFIVEGAFSPNADRGHGYLPFNISWYRKHFTVDASLQGSLIWLDFDGVYKNSDVWLNGVWLGHFTSGYVSFRYFLHNVTAPNSTTPVLVYGGGDNVLAVRVDALSAQEGWFYEGGGITRHVWMNTADPLSIVPWGAYFPSAITGPITSGPNGSYGPQTTTSTLIMAQVDVANGRAAASNFTITITLLDTANGNGVLATSTTAGSLASGGWNRYNPQISVKAPTINLWNTEVPYLYTVNTTITDAANGAIIDAMSVNIGFRDAMWSPNTGFTLNGFKVPAQGFSNHQDFAGCGTAVPDRVNEFRVTSMRAIGSNFWRTAHNPTNPELLDYADKYGMLMWVENRFINYGVQPMLSSKDTPLPPTVAVAEPQLLLDAQNMVLRDRNHPSVVIWSLCNEGGCEIGAQYGGVIGAQFKDVISAADTQRPITANSEWSIGSSDTLTNVVDVFTCSYNYGTYSQYHYTHPWKPVMGGESASCTSDRGYYLASNATTGHVYSDDDSCVVSAWQSAAVNPWDSGNFAWTGHDYKGEPTPFNWPDVNSHFGVLDLAGFEKDTAGYYRAWWLANGSTYLKLVPRDWTAPVPVGQQVTLRAFTGAASVEAFVNGVSLGKQPVGEYGSVAWPAVAFQPGNISATAYDSNNNVVATDLVITVGQASQIKVSIVNVGAASYAADGQDVAMFTVELLDANGNFVANSNNQLTFTVSGPGAVYGIGNGDPADHTPDKVGNPDLPYGGQWIRSAWMGLARAIVQTQRGTPGQITLTVTSPGLTTGQAYFTSQ